jgi:hypothetical protein
MEEIKLYNGQETLFFDQLHINTFGMKNSCLVLLELQNY